MATNTLASSATSSRSRVDRSNYCTQTSLEVRQLQKMYAQSAHNRNESPVAYRQRMELAERINYLLSTVTLEEQKEYDIW